MRYRNYSITNVGKVRSANEDNYGDANTPNGHLFVVCDGMGGHVGGAKASSIAVASIIEYFQREKHSNIIQAIDRAFTFANEQIFANALSSPELKGMGTTSVVLIISGDDCYIGHVGDSRIYLKSNNRLHRITKDHSFVQTLVDSGVISDEEAESHPNKNQILKALGTSYVVEGTICRVPLQVKAGDVFLLCSDGLNGMVNDKGLEMMLQGQNLTQSGEDLIRAALDAGGLDNVTATMVAIDENNYTTSKFVDFNPNKKFDGSSTQAFMTSPNTSSKSKIFSTKSIFLLSVFVIFIGIIGYFLLFKNKSGNDDFDQSKLVKKEIKGEKSIPNENDNAEEVQKEDNKKNEPNSSKVSGKDKSKKENKSSEDGAKFINHKVVKGEILGVIIEKYIGKYPKLTESKIITYNQQNNDVYKGENGEKLETDKTIKEGKILLIPTE